MLKITNKLNLVITFRGALDVGVYIYILIAAIKTTTSPPRAPSLLCQCCAICSRAVTILELTASQHSLAAVAFLSSTIPTPSFLISGSPSPDKVRPECNKVYPSAFQTSYPNHLSPVFQQLPLLTSSVLSSKNLTSHQHNGGLWITDGNFRDLV